MEKIISIKNLTFKYGKNVLFDNLSMYVEEGQFISIIGSNNCGKTTLIKLMAGILPNNKAITVKFSYVNNKKIQDCANQFGVAIHDFSNKFLFEKVYDELAFPLENLNMKKDVIEDRIIEVSKLFKINDLLDKKIADITNSEKQKLILTLAYIHKPKILLLDCPFIMMTNKDKKEMLSVLKKINKEDKVTIILTTNNLDNVLDSDYIYVFDNGKIVIEGTPLSVFNEEKILNRIGLSLPFMVDLSLKLQFYDVIDNTIIDLDGMVNTLWK